ncbi:MAG: TIM barrel protein [Planctomycetota bacterium]|nr:TIM barrel protein [Planctomycetota bacterium]MDA1163490.1 TIM barrel protein [Planctomycetota bacterium]
MSTFTNPVSRRQFLATSAAGAATLAGISTASAADPYGGFKMGMQSYSLRGFDAVTALKHTQTLGLKYWEAYPKHVPMGTLPEHVATQKKMLDDAGVKLIAYGVLGFDGNETSARQAFDFAKAMGIASLSANPKKDNKTFDLLDKLCEEYEVAIAIHNHGPNALYDKISDTVDIVKDRHPLIGGCVDTGHYLRSDEEPVEAIERLGKRTFGVHFKDVQTITENGKSKKHFRILGEGDLNVLGCLKALKKLDYQYSLSLEYEENPSNPLSDIEVCLKTVRDAVAKL